MILICSGLIDDMIRGSGKEMWGWSTRRRKERKKERKKEKKKEKKESFFPLVPWTLSPNPINVRILCCRGQVTYLTYLYLELYHPTTTFYKYVAYMPYNDNRSAKTIMNEKVTGSVYAKKRKRKGPC